MERNEISTLIKAYLDGTATHAERRIVELHYLDYLDRATARPSQEQLDRSFDKTYSRLIASMKTGTRQVRNPLWLRTLPYVAAVLLISGIVSLIYVNYTPPVDYEKIASRDTISPGGNRATLTMEGGERIALDETQEGLVMQDGRIRYSDGSPVLNDLPKAKRYTLQTPNGGTYQLLLPDGTKVWLNADSHISYAADFESSDSRAIQLQGEAYFQVAKRKNQPFVVTTEREQIEVLGTHFNVNSYGNETSSRTTLLEGAVRINSGIVLKPGQQAIIDGRGDLKVVTVDTDRVIAWKQGKFVFESEGLESVMQKIARWYDVEVVYRGSVSGKTFSGTVSRFEDIHKLLHTITYTSDVRFKVEGRRITVMP